MGTLALPIQAPQLIRDERTHSPLLVASPLQMRKLVLPLTHWSLSVPCLWTIGLSIKGYVCTGLGLTRIRTGFQYTQQSIKSFGAWVYASLFKTMIQGTPYQLLGWTVFETLIWPSQYQHCIYKDQVGNAANETSAGSGGLAPPYHHLRFRRAHLGVCSDKV